LKSLFQTFDPLSYLLISAVPKLRSFLIYWLPVLIWMAIIFTASSDRMSFQHSSRIIGPLIHWVLPNLSEANLHRIVLFVRKCAHLTEYAILALLIWRALVKPARRVPHSWNWQIAWQTIFIVFCYAASDEFHQVFVPAREASIRDVLLDTIGGVIAVAALWALNRRHENRKVSAN
jgi:VanZ family protein